MMRNRPMLLGLLLGGLVWWVLHGSAEGGHAANYPIAPTASPGTACGPLPAPGTTSILDGGSIRRDTAQQGALVLRNDLASPLVAVLGDTALTRRYQAAVVAAGQEVKIQAPAGHYGFLLMTGQVWCSLARGFSDGSRHSINGGIIVRSGTTTQARVAPGPQQISVEYRTLHSMDELRDGGLEIRQSPGGFLTAGSINGHPVTFMVDTGASHVAVPAALASAAGVSCAQRSQYSTAAGRIDACVGRADEVVFGPFKVRNVEVAIMPEADHVLLGMDVLRQFSMVWQGDVVRISAQGIQAPGTVRPFAPVVPWPETSIQKVANGERRVPRERSFAMPSEGLWLIGLGVAVLLLTHLRRKGPLRPTGQRNIAGRVWSMRLLRACGGDVQRAARLREYETRRAPGISSEEAAQRAIERLERDRS